MTAKRLVSIVFLISTVAGGSSLQGEELTGRVQEVAGARITIAINPDVLPNPGDKVEVFDTIVGIGDVVLDCEWRVESVEKDSVKAVTQDKSKATAQPGYKVIIHSPNPRRLKPPADASQPPAQKPPDQKPAAKAPPGDAKTSEKTPLAGPAVKGEQPSGTSPGTGSSTVAVVFDKTPGAGGGVTLDDVVRLNKGPVAGVETSRGPVAPTDLQAQEPWVVQWQVHDVLVDFPGGGRAGLYIDPIRCGRANPSPGRRGILYLHPIDSAKPVRIVNSTILRGPAPVLKLGVCGNRDIDGDWLLVVNINDARLGPERLIRGTEGWQDLTYDLSGFPIGKPVLISVEAHANDWQCEFAFFDYIRIEDEIPPASTQNAWPAAVESKAALPSGNVRVERVIISDDFDLENKGRGQLCYDGFENWFVRSGEVDLIGRGFYDAYPDHGLYVDLDGGGLLASTFQSKGAFRLSAGVYQLEFDLAGNPERTTNTVTVSLGGLYNESFTLDAKEPFRTIRRQVTVAQAVNAAMVFKHAGRDGAGLLLDNVRLVGISSPTSTSSVPAQDAQSVSASKTPAETRSAYLGALVQKGTGGRLVISDVTPQSPADRAGLRKGDVIVQIDDRSVEGTLAVLGEFARTVSTLPMDRPVRFAIQRDQKRIDIWVRLAAGMHQ